MFTVQQNAPPQSINNPKSRQIDYSLFILSSSFFRRLFSSMISYSVSDQSCQPPASAICHLDWWSIGMGLTDWPSDWLINWSKYAEYPSWATLNLHVLLDVRHKALNFPARRTTFVTIAIFRARIHSLKSRHSNLWPRYDLHIVGHDVYT